ncbi:MAG: ADP-ribosylglycohydrolase family protein, partial [Planctomycetota bacterium]|nr:ADP-ribosylglycohydrolase family protein [Planctomycetota bacterium]
MRSMGVAGFVAVALVSAASGQSYSGQRLVREAAYREQVRGMWLGECIANWTGLQTEGRHREPPFLTDASWGVVQPYSNGFPLEHKWFFNPWWADDDTDIEYVYQHLMVSQNTLFLTPVQIAQGWTLHINRFIWVSNATARGLIGRGAMPPSTGISSANVNRLEIDAQLTTELFGVLAPGMPGRALELADLPIRTIAAGYALHASQFYVVLYSLA